MRTFVGMLCLILAAAGCANMTWERPDTDPAVAGADYKQCQQEAILSARRLSFVDPQNSPRVIRGPGGERTVIMPSPFPARDPLMEMDFLGQCLRAKGYVLVEVK